MDSASYAKQVAKQLMGRATMDGCVICGILALKSIAGDCGILALARPARSVGPLTRISRPNGA